MKLANWKRLYVIVMAVAAAVALALAARPAI
jgi:hypothetical protein